MGTCRWTPPDSARPGAGGEEPEPAAAAPGDGAGPAEARGGTDTCPVPRQGAVPPA